MQPLVPMNNENDEITERIMKLSAASLRALVAELRSELRSELMEDREDEVSIVQLIEIIEDLIVFRTRFGERSEQLTNEN